MRFNQILLQPIHLYGNMHLCFAFSLLQQLRYFPVLCKRDSLNCLRIAHPVPDIAGSDRDLIRTGFQII